MVSTTPPYVVAVDSSAASNQYAIAIATLAQAYSAKTMKLNIILRK